MDLLELILITIKTEVKLLPTGFILKTLEEGKTYNTNSYSPVDMFTSIAPF